MNTSRELLLEMIQHEPTASNSTDRPTRTWHRWK